MVRAPALEFVFEARVTIAPTVDMGETPRGRQRMIPITGGVVEGPNFRGTVLAGGADWQILRPDGATELTAQYVIRAEDGTQIAVINRALRHAPPEINARLLANEKVDPDLVYFRGSPTFASAAPTHDWLNRSVFICTGERWPDGVLLHFFRVL
ncbi:MAG TPA: DUF3237 domain-containing protein [Stellaceae bacterium]